MSLCCKRFINHTNFIHMKFICILVGTLVLSNLNTDSPPHPFPSLLDSVLLWQENIEMHLQEKTNQADVVCCLQHLQVLYFFSLLSLSLSLSHGSVLPFRVSDSKS
jgi:hypothetical protein